MRLPGAILLHYFSWFYAIKKGPKHRKPISNSWKKTPKTMPNYCPTQLPSIGKDSSLVPASIPRIIAQIRHQKHQGMTKTVFQHIFKISLFGHCNAHLPKHQTQIKLKLNPLETQSSSIQTQFELNLNSIWTQFELNLNSIWTQFTFTFEFKLSLEIELNLSLNWVWRKKQSWSTTPGTHP